jgi:SET domain-containing protein
MAFPKHTVLPMPLRSSSSRRRFRVGRSKSGLGLFAVKPIKKGEFIAYYTGRIISNAEADKLWTKYLFELNNRWTIDGSSRRNTARYINHSCRPNAETDVKKHKIIITAIKNIQPGDEITYNYGRNYFNAFIKPIGCRCEACRKKRLEARRERRRAAERKSRRRRTA